MTPAAPPQLSAEEYALLARRAELLRARPERAADGTLAWVAAFSVGDEEYAIPLLSLTATLPLRAVTPVPLADPRVIGVLRHEGELLTVFSLAALLGSRGWREDPAILLVVEAGSGRRVALDCGEVPLAEALPFPQALEARAAVVQLDLPGRRRVHLLDIGKLVAPSGPADGI